MKWFQKYLFLYLLLCTVFLQSCGGKTDTNGSLALSNPVLSDNGDGSYSITTTATFSPPVGKVPNGVVIHFVASDGVSSVSLDKTLTSSPAVIVSFRIPQSTASSVTVRITASIGDMESSVSATIPVLGAVNAAPVQFTDADVAFTTKTSTISGGIPPYILQSPNTADLSASIVGGNTFTVTKNSAAGVVAQAPVIFLIADSQGNTGQVQVNYFK